MHIHCTPSLYLYGNVCFTTFFAVLRTSTVRSIIKEGIKYSLSHNCLRLGGHCYLFESALSGRDNELSNNESRVLCIMRLLHTLIIYIY